MKLFFILQILSSSFYITLGKNETTNIHVEAHSVFLCANPEKFRGIVSGPNSSSYVFGSTCHSAINSTRPYDLQVTNVDSKTQSFVYNLFSYAGLNCQTMDLIVNPATNYSKTVASGSGNGFPIANNQVNCYLYASIYSGDVSTQLVGITQNEHSLDVSGTVLTGANMSSIITVGESFSIIWKSNLTLCSGYAKIWSSVNYMIPDTTFVEEKMLLKNDIFCPGIEPCRFTSYKYSHYTTNCEREHTGSPPDDYDRGSYVGISFGCILIVFWVLVIIFAVKRHRKQNSENEDISDDPQCQEPVVYSIPHNSTNTSQPLSPGFPQPSGETTSTVYAIYQSEVPSNPYSVSAYEPQNKADY